MAHATVPRPHSTPAESGHTSCFKPTALQKHQTHPVVHLFAALPADSNNAVLYVRRLRRCRAWCPVRLPRDGLAGDAGPRRRQEWAEPGECSSGAAARLRLCCALQARSCMPAHAVCRIARAHGPAERAETRPGRPRAAGRSSGAAAAASGGWQQYAATAAALLACHTTVTHTRAAAAPAPLPAACRTNHRAAVRTPAPPRASAATRPRAWSATRLR
jgi:hypothetical protein